MANNLIKLVETHSQGVIEVDAQVWCATHTSDAERTLCGDAIDELNVIRCLQKTTKRGGITCPLCLDVIRHIKSIKL